MWLTPPRPAALPLLLAVVASCGGVPTGDATTSITVVATDYAFTAPDTVEAGLVAWTLRDDGADSHHLIVVRIGDGHTTAEALAAVATSGPVPPWLETLGGVEDAEQEIDVGDDFITLLEPGSHLLLCILPHPDGGTHAAHGMVRPFTVVATERAPAPDPVATDTIRMVDFAFGIPDTIGAGARTFLLLNRGAQRHHAVLEQVPDGATMEQVFADFELEEPPPGYRPLGGFTSIGPGRQGWFRVTLAPGRYLLACLIADPATGRVHVELGMGRLFDVVAAE